MVALDMGRYRPFRDMGATCRTREIGEKKVVWVDYTSPPFFRKRFRVRQIGLADVEATAELWRQGYPEIYGSPHEFLLFPEKYAALVALRETWAEDAVNKRYCVPVVEELATGRLVAAALLTKEDMNLQIEASLICTHPDYRGQHIMAGLGYAVREMIDRSGAEYVTTFLETWHDITQRIIGLGGWRVAGIFPGNFTRWQGGNREYRGCTVHVYRFVGEGEAYATRPEEWSLLPELRELWECLERVNRKLAEKHGRPDPERWRRLLFEE